jgi:DNA-binding PadR family transcriptional regulator
MLIKPKRPANPLALAVLTLLYERPMHPYEMAATLKERRKEASIKLNYGSLYTVIEGLLREKFIRDLETTREGRRPERTVYALTTLGESEMLSWMRDLVRTPAKEYPQFEAALSLLPVLPPEEAIELLAQRIQLLKAVIASFKIEEQERQAMKLPRLFAIESEFHEAMVHTEFQYIESLLRDLKRDAKGLTTDWKNIRQFLLKSKKTNAKGERK